jgi:hypothetical protein
MRWLPLFLLIASLVLIIVPIVLLGTVNVLAAEVAAWLIGSVMLTVYVCVRLSAWTPESRVMAKIMTNEYKMPGSKIAKFNDGDEVEEDDESMMYDREGIEVLQKGGGVSKEKVSGIRKRMGTMGVSIAAAGMIGAHSDSVLGMASAEIVGAEECCSGIMALKAGRYCAMDLVSFVRECKELKSGEGMTSSLLSGLGAFAEYDYKSLYGRQVCVHTEGCDNMYATLINWATYIIAWFLVTGLLSTGIWLIWALLTNPSGEITNTKSESMGGMKKIKTVKHSTYGSFVRFLASFGIAIIFSGVMAFAIRQLRQFKGTANASYGKDQIGDGGDLVRGVPVAMMWMKQSKSGKGNVFVKAVVLMMMLAGQAEALWMRPDGFKVDVTGSMQLLAERVDKISNMAKSSSDVGMVSFVDGILQTKSQNSLKHMAMIFASYGGLDCKMNFEDSKVFMASFVCTERGEIGPMEIEKVKGKGVCKELSGQTGRQTGKMECLVKDGIVTAARMKELDASQKIVMVINGPVPTNITITTTPRIGEGVYVLPPGYVLGDYMSPYCASSGVTFRGGVATIVRINGPNGQFPGCTSSDAGYLAYKCMQDQKFDWSCPNSLIAVGTIGGSVFTCVDIETRRDCAYNIQSSAITVDYLGFKGTVMSTVDKARGSDLCTSSLLRYHQTLPYWKYTSFTNSAGCKLNNIQCLYYGEKTTGNYVSRTDAQYGGDKTRVTLKQITEEETKSWVPGSLAGDLSVSEQCGEFTFTGQREYVYNDVLLTPPGFVIKSKRCMKPIRIRSYQDAEQQMGTTKNFVYAGAVVIEERVSEEAYLAIRRGGMIYATPLTLQYLEERSLLGMDHAADNNATGDACSLIGTRSGDCGDNSKNDYKLCGHTMGERFSNWLTGDDRHYASLTAVTQPGYVTNPFSSLFFQNKGSFCSTSHDGPQKCDLISNMQSVLKLRARTTKGGLMITTFSQNPGCAKAGKCTLGKFTSQHMDNHTDPWEQVGNEYVAKYIAEFYLSVKMSGPGYVGLKVFGFDLENIVIRSDVCPDPNMLRVRGRCAGLTTETSSNDVKIGNFPGGDVLYMTDFGISAGMPAQHRELANRLMVQSTSFGSPAVTNYCACTHAFGFMTSNSKIGIAYLGADGLSQSWPEVSEKGFCSIVYVNASSTWSNQCDGSPALPSSIVETGSMYSYSTPGFAILAVSEGKGSISSDEVNNVYIVTTDNDMNILEERMLATDKVSFKTENNGLVFLQIGEDVSRYREDKDASNSVLINWWYEMYVRSPVWAVLIAILSSIGMVLAGIYLLLGMAGYFLNLMFWKWLLKCMVFAHGEKCKHCGLRKGKASDNWFMQNFLGRCDSKSIAMEEQVHKKYCTPKRRGIEYLKDKMAIDGSYVKRSETKEMFGSVCYKCHLSKTDYDRESKTYRPTGESIGVVVDHVKYKMGPCGVFGDTTAFKMHMFDHFYLNMNWFWGRIRLRRRTMKHIFLAVMTASLVNGIGGQDYAIGEEIYNGITVSGEINRLNGNFGTERVLTQDEVTCSTNECTFNVNMVGMRAVKGNVVRLSHKSEDGLSYAMYIKVKDVRIENECAYEYSSSQAKVKETRLAWCCSGSQPCYADKDMMKEYLCGHQNDPRYIAYNTLEPLKSLNCPGEEDCVSPVGKILWLGAGCIANKGAIVGGRYYYPSEVGKMLSVFNCQVRQVKMTICTGNDLQQMGSCREINGEDVAITGSLNFIGVNTALPYMYRVAAMHETGSEHVNMLFWNPPELAQTSTGVFAFKSPKISKTGACPMGSRVDGKSCFIDRTGSKPHVRCSEEGMPITAKNVNNVLDILDKRMNCNNEMSTLSYEVLSEMRTISIGGQTFSEKQEFLMPRLNLSSVECMLGWISIATADLGSSLKVVKYEGDAKFIECIGDANRNMMTLMRFEFTDGGTGLFDLECFGISSRTCMIDTSSQTTCNTTFLYPWKGYCKYGEKSLYVDCTGIGWSDRDFSTGHDAHGSYEVGNWQYGITQSFLHSWWGILVLVLGCSILLVMLFLLVKACIETRTVKVKRM